MYKSTKVPCGTTCFQKFSGQHAVRQTDLDSKKGWAQALLSESEFRQMLNLPILEQIYRAPINAPSEDPIRAIMERTRKSTVPESE
jgi:hypothetical protein